MESKWSVENVISRRKQCIETIRITSLLNIIFKKGIELSENHLYLDLKLAYYTTPIMSFQEPQSCGLLIWAVATVKNIIPQNPPAGT